MAIVALIFLLLVAETSTQSYEQFVLETYRDLCPFSSTCTLPPQLDFPYYNKQKISCCLPCYCEQSCMETNSCCPDARNESILPDLDKTTECLSVAHPVEDRGNDGFHSEFKRYNTIRTCPSTYRKKVDRLMCTRRSPKTIDEHIFVSDEAGNIYRNRHCALCNGVVKYTQWTLFVKCSINVFNANFSRQPSIELIKNPDCEAWSEAPGHISLPSNSRCYLTKYDKCNVTGKWNKHDSNIDKACSIGQYAPFVQKGVVSKNVFCFVCNIDDDVDDELQDECSYWLIRTPIVYPLTILLDIKEPSSTQDTTSRCMSSKIYDKYSDVCRDLICPVHSVPAYGTCLKVFTATDGLPVAFEILLTSMASLKNENDIEFAALALNNMIKNQDGNCSICSNIIQQNTTKQNLTLSANLELVTSPTCLETTIVDIANMLNNNILYVDIDSTNNYTFVMNLNSQKPDKKIFDTINSHMPYHLYLEKSCTAPPLYLTDLLCPRIRISGLDYRNALRNNYIKPSQHYDNYIVDQEEKNLSNITFEICIDEYFSRNGGGRVGETTGFTYTILANRISVLVLPALVVVLLL